MSLFARNLTILAHKDAALKDISEHAADVPIRYELLPARNDSHTIAVHQPHNPPFYLYSTYAPEREVRALIDQLPITESSLVVFFGMGLLYHYQEVRNRFSTIRCIMLEGDPGLLRFVCEQIDMRGLGEDPHCRLLINRDTAMLEKQLREEMSGYEPNDIVLCQAPALVKTAPQWYERLRRFIEIQKKLKAYDTQAHQALVNDLCAYMKQYAGTRSAQIKQALAVLRSCEDFSMQAQPRGVPYLILLFQLCFSQDFGFRKTEGAQTVVKQQSRKQN